MCYVGIVRRLHEKKNEQKRQSKELKLSILKFTTSLMFCFLTCVFLKGPVPQSRMVREHFAILLFSLCDHRF